MNQRTLIIANAIRKTNPAAAQEYIAGAGRREYIDRQVADVYNPPPIVVDELPKKEKRRGRVQASHRGKFTIGDCGRAEFK